MTTTALPSIVSLAAIIAAREAEEKYGSAADACFENLAEFVKQAWVILEPHKQLIWSWYLDVICDALQRQIEGDPEYRKLVLCVPPGGMKSLLVSVFAPAWEWLRGPHKRKLFFANDDALAKRDSRRMRELIKSDWYRGLVVELARRGITEAWRLSKDQNEKVNFENSARGFRLCMSLGAKVTGKRADDIVIDDPLDAKEVINGSIEQVASRLEQCSNIVDQVLPSRVDNMATARWTIIMQRLHEDDTAGRAMREGGYKAIIFQMEFETGNKQNHEKDPRKQDGELLDPVRFPSPEVEKLKKKLGSNYSSQYQQRPLPRSGGPFKRWHWRFWYPRGSEPPPTVMVRKPDGSMHECKQVPLPERFDLQRQSWDMAFKDTRHSAFVVGQVWGDKGANGYLLDWVRERMDINASIEAVRSMSKRWPRAIEKLVEDKANGPAVMGMLRNEIVGLTEILPQGGKEARANASAPTVKSGNIYLPHPAINPRIEEFIAELESVPACQYWDQVDTFTQYVTHRWLNDTGPSVSVI